MKKQPWKVYAFWILLSEAVGAVSGWISRSGMERYSESVVQPALSPPMFLFPIVWVILYALMGIGAARVSLSPDSRHKDLALNLFVAQLVFNFFWTPIFFNAQAFGLAFGWIIVLWILVLAMILVFRKVDPLAAWLQLPYLAWLSFAAYLNYGVWMLN